MQLKTAERDVQHFVYADGGAKNYRDCHEDARAVEEPREGVATDENHEVHMGP